MPARRNSAYASSTTTTPGAASAMARTVASGSAVPVGLLGEVRSTTSGFSCAISASARSMSTEKSSLRCPATQRVWVLRAYSGYIEYVGANDSAVRPGPPNAWSTCCMISFDPLAAQIRSAVRPCPRYAARPVRSSRASRSGYRFSDSATRCTASAMSRAVSVAGTVRVLVGVELHGHVELRRAVRLLVPQLLADRDPGRDRHQRDVRTETAAPCDGRFSASASVTTWSPTSRSAASEYVTTCMFLQNARTDRPEEWQAHPAVGRTWLEPAA